MTRPITDDAAHVLLMLSSHSLLSTWLVPKTR